MDRVFSAADLASGDATSELTWYFKLSKRNKPRPHLKKWQNVKPDESFSFGPMRVSRHGRFVHLENRATPEEHSLMLERMAEVHLNVTKELASAITALQAEIRPYDPIELMHRAAYELLPLLLKYYSENEYSPEESFALPAVEYLQYLISRTPTEADPTDSIEEGTWNTLWLQLSNALKLTQDYLFTRPTLSTPPTEIDELRFFTDARRLAIRIRRYAIYFTDHLRDALVPLQAGIQDAYGLTIEQLIDGLKAIQVYQSTGIFDRYLALQKSHEAFVDDVKRFQSSEGVSETGSDMQEPIVPSEIQRLYDEVNENARLALTPAAFDITDLSGLPHAILSILAVKPGESILTSLTGPAHDDLSPLSTSILHDKPFIESNGRVYNFYHSGLEDRVTEILEADLFARYPERETSLRRARDSYLETIAIDLLALVIKPETEYRNAYYPNPDHEGGLTELDALLTLDDVLFLVEVKAAGLSAAARRGAPQSLYNELNETIGTGQRQSERAEKYISSAPEVRFFDSSGQRAIGRIRRSDFRRIFRVVVTREDLGWVGARIAILSVIEPTLSTSQPWHVSLDDLRAIAELFQDSNLRFVHFLEQRLEASDEPILAQHDEIEHVGLYNKINLYHELPVRGIDRMSFDPSWMRDIDEYFSKKYRGEEPELPGQQMPSELAALMVTLKDSGLRGRFGAASTILDMDNESRIELARALAYLDAGLDEGRPRSFRMQFSSASCGLSVTYFHDNLWEQELIRSAAQMEHSQCSRWLVLQLQEHSPYLISKIDTIVPGRFSFEELTPGFDYIKQMTRQKIENEKPGRNDRCPCGSSKKYKKCHGA